MSSLELIQGSEEWLAWRRKGIGASDAPIIMGASPYSNITTLFAQKMGRAPETVSNWAMERGQRLEPKARAKYELLYDLEMPPMLFEHPTIPQLRASLDGCNVEKRIILEIKYVGKANHELAKQGTVPPHYEWQLDHQLMVTGFELVHYVSYFEEKDGSGADLTLVEYKRSSDREAILLENELRFWECMQKDIQPIENKVKKTRKKKTACTA